MNISLNQAFLLLQTEEEVSDFLADLCTPQEIYALKERWLVCKLLSQGNLSYREIRQMTGASLTTIGRVARFLNYESNNGYKTILTRINEKC